MAFEVFPKNNIPNSQKSSPRSSSFEVFPDSATEQVKPAAKTKPLQPAGTTQQGFRQLEAQSEKLKPSQWSLSHPKTFLALNNAMKPVSKVLSPLLDNPWAQRAGRAGAEVMTMTDQAKPTTGSKLGDVSADIMGNVMGFVTNPEGGVKSLGSNLWKGAEDLGSNLGRIALPKLAAKTPGVVKAGANAVLPSVAYEATQAGANERPASGAQLGESAAANALIAGATHGLLRGSIEPARNNLTPTVDLPKAPATSELGVNPLQQAAKQPMANDAASIINDLKAIVPGVEHAPEALQKPDFQAANTLAKTISGREIIPFKGTKKFAGAQTEGKILLNADTKEPVLYIANHEIAHTIKSSSPETYSRLEQIVREHVADSDGLRAHYESFGYKPEDIPNELTADAMAESMLEPTFWAKVRNQAPELLQPVLDAIDNVINTVKQKAGEDMTIAPYLRDLETMRDRLANEYGSYLAETRAGQNTAMSKSPILKERQFAQNVRESQIAPGVVKENLDKNQLTYEPITNKETLDRATAAVANDYTKAIQEFNDARRGVNADDVALGEALITKAIKEGNADEANRLIADLAEKLTTAGQAVQAASIFKRLTPEGMLLYAQRLINRANKDLFERLGSKAQKIVLSSDDSQFILDTMKNVQIMPESRARDVELAKVMQRIANKVPSTSGEKVKGLQRISMLLNPKTMTKNAVGNALFATADNISNVLATPLDIATSKLTGNRTTTLPSITGQLKSMKKGAKETIEDYRLGIDTYPAQTQYELPNKRIFKNRALNKLDRVTRAGLQLGDRPFFQAAYDDSLRQQMNLAKVSEPTQAMIDQATKTAKERTYQDVNKITQLADGFRNSLNKIGTKDFGFGNIVTPFTKTPANILARAIDYSPAGLNKAVSEAVNLAKKNGKFDQKAFVDSISRAATGTGIIIAGYELAQKGIITGTGNKDKDIASFERNLGKSDFSVKLGDTYYTYDWAQPVSMALAIGADMYLKGKSRKEAENAVIEGIKSGGETLLKQSFLQGIQQLFGGYAPLDNLEQTAYNAPAQFIPTLSNQITQLTDPLKRSTAANSAQGKALNTVKAKIPGLSKTLQPSIDTLGQPIKQYQGKNNLFNVFLNPGRSTEFKPDKVQSEILRVYESTGEKDVFPKVAPKSITSKGQTITLTPEEITKFQQTMGRQTYNKLKNIVNLPYSDEQKSKIMAREIDKAYDNAKRELLNGRK